VKDAIPQHSHPRHGLRFVSASTIATFLIAAVPKCPMCWIAVMGGLGAASTIHLRWLQPLAIALLFSSLLALFLRSRRRSGYGPFLLGLIAGVAMYEFKFVLDSGVGVSLSAVTLFGSSIWSSLQPPTAEQNPAECPACSLRSAARHRLWSPGPARPSSIVNQ
jgi:hypothetical protein